MSWTNLPCPIGAGDCPGLKPKWTVPKDSHPKDRCPNNMWSCLKAAQERAG